MRWILALLLLPACAQLSVRDADLAGLREGHLDPCSVVLIAGGMLRDLGLPGAFQVRDEVARQGAVGLVFPYFSGPLGVWLNTGAIAPGRLMAETADQLAILHARSGCPVPLRVSAFGFSAGCEAILAAARRLRHAVFDRVAFVGCSAFLATPVSPRIGELRNYWSPIDLVNVLAPAGAGQFGLYTGEAENRLLWQPHLCWFPDRVVAEVAGHLGTAAATRPEQELFRQRLADWLEAHRQRRR